MFNVILIVETFLAFVVAVVIHEMAHVGMAALLGDRTPVSRGRSTLSPRRQLAPIGTLVAVALSFSGLGLGWGKPLELDARRMRVGPNLGTILVAVAGPLVNAILGIGIIFGLRSLPGFTSLDAASNVCYGQFGVHMQQCLTHQVGQMGVVLRAEQLVFIFAVTNILIALVNIIPLQPLDGYLVLFALLPTRQAIAYRSWAPYMELILLVIFFVLPVIFQFIGIASFNPAAWLGGMAHTIAGRFTDGAYDFAVVM